jgi:glycyl-tRNA synthetase beta chain
MPQLLLELFSEEVPARMQAAAARDLERLARDHLAKAEAAFEAVRAFAGPRRLTLVVDGLPTAQADRLEERKGPRLGAPEAAMAGFLRSAGVTRDRLVERDGAWFARIARPGRPTADVIAEMTVAIVRGFPWPKSMIWGTGALRWVRPLHRILCVFDGRVVPLTIEGLESADLTEGHRFMGDATPFRAGDFEDYREALASHFVVLEAETRKRVILEGARGLCAARGLELVEDAGLLDEVAGMVEWPVPLLGDMAPAFLDLPPEVIRTSMRAHQRYFATRSPGAAGLAPHFVTVANIAARDGGALITAGNARVLAARLNDARFFWNEDRKASLESRLGKLRGVTFHARLGTMFQRVERIEGLARQIAPLLSADPDMTAHAARLCKADLGTAMVGEFPELQGIMGGYYARAEGLAAEIADAIRDHYKPQGPGDSPPTAPISTALALADKLDTLTSFFSINEKPTGSRDPYALRRAALGVIRILLTGRWRLSLRALIGPAQSDDLMAFFADRLKVLLREQGERHDLVDAVLALGDDDLVRVVARVEALTAFLASENGVNLLAGYKRGANILAAEARKGPLPEGDPAVLPGSPPEEVGLLNALGVARREVKAALRVEDFAAAMRALAALRGPVDEFFNNVLINAPDPEARDNRLRLLSRMRGAMGEVADFSVISG